MSQNGQVAASLRPAPASPAERQEFSSATSCRPWRRHRPSAWPAQYRLRRSVLRKGSVACSYHLDSGLEPAAAFGCLVALWSAMRRLTAALGAHPPTAPPREMDRSSSARLPRLAVPAHLARNSRRSERTASVRGGSSGSG